ncbi:putative adhesin [Trinorchestia longiramus]|nr:putative adhesin [Trinorchestia longiramus]
MLLKYLCPNGLSNVRCIARCVARPLLEKSGFRGIKSAPLHTSSLSALIGFCLHRSRGRLLCSNFSRSCAQLRSNYAPDVPRTAMGAVMPCVFSKLPYSSSSLEPMKEVSSEVVSVRPYYGLLRLSGDVRFVVIPDIEHQCGTVCCVRVLASDATADVRVQLQEEGSVVHVEATQRSDSNCSPVCEVKLPVKYDIEASLQGHGSIEISELQNESTSVTTEEGSLSVQKLQCLKLSYATKSGPLFIGRKLLGNLNASAENLLDISGDMIQAEAVDVRSPAVECRLRGLHAKSLRVKADDATLHLTDVTCDASSVEAQSADIVIGNCSGSLEWRLRSTKLEVAVPQLLKNSSIIVGAGSVSIGCPTEYRYGFSATAPEVIVNSSFEDVSSSSVDGISSANGGPSVPLLSVSLEQGRCAVVPWTWPRTNHSSQ